MGQITLRPELVTSSGEACGIMLDNQYVGSLTLLYREEDRIWGSVQLDEQVLQADEKEEVDLFIHRYIENMIDAIGAPECFVSSTYAHYDHIISTDQLDDLVEILEDETGPLDYSEYDTFEAGYEEVTDSLTTDDVQEYDFDYDLSEHKRDIELNIVGESRNKVEYQLLDRNHEIMAEVMVHLDRGDVIGDVYWHYEPTDEEMDEVAHILVADFDSDHVDTFTFAMFYGDEELVTFELTHDDLLDDEEEAMLLGEIDLDEDDIYVDIHGDDAANIHFELIRDDIDSLTFDVYEEEKGYSVRLGTATIDLDGEEPTAIIDFDNPRDQHLREQVAYYLIDELDKEVEYQTFTITMQYDDEVIDEYIFDIEEQPDFCDC